MSLDKQRLQQSPLGKEIPYNDQYNPKLLFPIQRNHQQPLSFYGVDIWNAYEISWLNSKGKPCVAMGEFIFPCDSPSLLESKSFKIYLHSFNQTRFNSLEEVSEVLRRDLSSVVDAPVSVTLRLLSELQPITLTSFSGKCLDDLDVACDTYEVNPEFLQTESGVVTETLYSNLLKSNCLVTNQPDWGCIQIAYSGKKINHEGLLKYIVSFRKQDEFHEQCVERTFRDIMTSCHPEKLAVYARYTRRGGLDINPYRSTEMGLPVNVQLLRQ